MPKIYDDVEAWGMHVNGFVMGFLQAITMMKDSPKTFHNISEETAEKLALSAYEAGVEEQDQRLQGKQN